MVYETDQGDVELERLTRLYPAVVVDMQGEVAEMSLEWEELYGDKVKIVHYVLVFDFTRPHEDVRDRVVLTFDSKEALIAEINEVAKYLH